MIEGCSFHSLWSDACIHPDLSDANKIPIHNVQTAEGRLTGLRFLDAEHDTEALYMPGTSGCFFLRQSMSERKQCARIDRILGFGRRSAGGNGTEVTLGLAGILQLLVG